MGGATAPLGMGDFNETHVVPEGIRQQQPAEHIMQFFSWHHLPTFLQGTSAPFAALAEEIVASVPRNPERTVALRKLLEAKDAAVRAVLAK